MLEGWKGGAGEGSDRIEGGAVCARFESGAMYQIALKTSAKTRRVRERASEPSIRAKCALVGDGTRW